MFLCSLLMLTSKYHSSNILFKNLNYLYSHRSERESMERTEAKFIET